jgi:hypothetical protein
MAKNTAKKGFTELPPLSSILGGFSHLKWQNLSIERNEGARRQRAERRRADFTQ